MRKCVHRERCLILAVGFNPRNARTTATRVALATDEKINDFQLSLTRHRNRNAHHAWVETHG